MKHDGQTNKLEYMYYVLNKTNKRSSLHELNKLIPKIEFEKSINTLEFTEAWNFNISEHKNSSQGPINLNTEYNKKPTQWDYINFVASIKNLIKNDTISCKNIKELLKNYNLYNNDDELDSSDED